MFKHGAVKVILPKGRAYCLKLASNEPRIKARVVGDDSTLFEIGSQLFGVNCEAILKGKKRVIVPMNFASPGMTWTARVEHQVCALCFEGSVAAQLVEIVHLQHTQTNHAILGGQSSGFNIHYCDWRPHSSSLVCWPDFRS